MELFNFNFLGISGWGTALDYCDSEWFALERKQDHSVISETAPSTAFRTLVDYEGYFISSKGFMPTVVDIMVILIKFAHSGPF